MTIRVYVYSNFGFWFTLLTFFSILTCFAQLLLYHKAISMQENSNKRHPTPAIFSIIKKVLRSSNIILREITRLMKLSDECIFSCQLRNQFHCAVDWNGTHAQQATSRLYQAAW